TRWDTRVGYAAPHKHVAPAVARNRAPACRPAEARADHSDAHSWGRHLDALSSRGRTAVLNQPTAQCDQHAKRRWANSQSVQRSWLSLKRSEAIATHAAPRRHVRDDRRLLPVGVSARTWSWPSYLGYMLLSNVEISIRVAGVDHIPHSCDHWPG